MRCTWPLAVTLLSLASTVASVKLTDLFPRAAAGDGFVSVPVKSAPRTNRQQHSRLKRASQKAYEATLLNMYAFYAAEVKIGTPGQTVSLFLDTGSSELWVDPVCADIKAKTERDACEAAGSYHPSKSSSSDGPSGEKTFTYGGNSSAHISYYTDSISLGNAKIKNQKFGVATKSRNLQRGIIGLSPDLEGGFDSGKPYSLVLNSMAEQGVINSRVFSLDLRDVDETTGSIVYGGIDTSRFVGNLEKLPMVKDDDGLYRLATTISSFGITGDGLSSTASVSEKDSVVILDSGSTVSQLHAPLAGAFIDQFGTGKKTEAGLYLTDCSNQDREVSVNFGFGDKTIQVSLKDFIYQTASETADSGATCVLGFDITSGQQVLGDTILRAGYFVFDWDNQAVHLAQAADCDGGRIVAVGSGEDSIPDVTGACSSADVPTATSSTTFQASTPSNAPPQTTTADSGVLTSHVPVTTKTKTTQTGTGTTNTQAEAATTTTAGAQSTGKGDAAGVTLPAGWMMAGMAALAVGF